jgi:4-hydroxy-tetrahydrodipicolinate synthase
MEGRFGAVLTAMVTPFADDGALDLDGARDLARWLQDQGNEGLIIAGTTGESPTLTDEERLSLIAAVAEAVTIPVVAGTTTNDTAHSVHLTSQAHAVGAAGVLAVAPYYNRPSQAGFVAHFTAVAAATDLPVLVYDIPVRTGRKIATATLLRLARDVANVAGVKDAAGNPAETARLIAEAPSGYDVYSGDDGFTLPLLAVGAVGVIGVATHWCAPEVREMFDAFSKGDVDQARRLNARLLESFAFETGDDAPNPQPTKALLRGIGRPAGPCRLPMGPDPDWLAARANEVYTNLLATRA